MNDAGVWVFWVFLMLMILVLIRLLCTKMCRPKPPTPVVNGRIIRTIRIDPTPSSATTVNTTQRSMTAINPMPRSASAYNSTILSAPTFNSTPRPLPSRMAPVNDRQGNVFTISDDTSLNNGPARYPDFFYIEPNSVEGARIRAQLEKDEKELPSYEDVMNMSALNLTTPTAAVTTTVEPDELMVTVPPYSEIDPTPITAAATSTIAIEMASPTIAAPSTSRAAAATIILPITSSNTSV